MQNNFTEAETRQNVIDRQLAEAGWSVSSGNVRRELLLRQNVQLIREPREDYAAGDEFADYALLGKDAKPLALVEAKRASRDVLAGQRQAEDYARTAQTIYGIEPFLFLANGESIWFRDREPFPFRPIQSFLTPEDLTRRAFLRRYAATNLRAIEPNTETVSYPFQIEAIRRVTEALTGGQRSFLLVMATGTGKTRTAVALVDLLLRAKWVQRVLFLADRRELVRQALGDFKTHLPREPLARIEGGVVDHQATIHVTTYPSMLQVYRQLSPGYYDLIIADESHRSIYNHYRKVIEYFDAFQLGLTATPTDYIDHNTFELFGCPDGLPTFYYPYEEAVREEYLVGYKVFEAQTSFQIQGIKAGQLPEEFQSQLAAQGIDLDDVNFEGSDLERRVTNTGTNDAIVREFMARCRKDASGTLPAKSIFFAMSHRHARELWDSFRRYDPGLHRRGLVEVIDSQVERADRLLDDFKRKDMPRVAISVDMLDTGVDIPAVQNLVFAKPVFSQVKFWQMIGRGTRRWTNVQTGEPKQDFLIIDHWNNFAYFNLNPEGEVASTSEALPTRLFRSRLEKLLLLRGHGDVATAQLTVAQLQAMLAQLPAENLNVRPHAVLLRELADDAAWEQISPERLQQLQTAIAPLLRLLPDVVLPVMTFEVKIERLAIAYLTGQQLQIERLRTQIVDDLQRLPTELREVQAEVQNLRWMTSDAFWDSLTSDRIGQLGRTWAPLMRFRRQQHREYIRLNLPDQITSRRWIIYGPGGEGAFAESYRAQVETHIRALGESHPTMRRLRRGEQLDDADLVALAAVLDQADLFINEQRLREVYERPDVSLIDLLRHVLGTQLLPGREERIKAAFDAFIAASPGLTATQITFLRTLRAAALRRAQITPADLARPPFSQIGVAEKLFAPAKLDELLALTNRLAA
jgi:type I restriction enzyme, R subunit